MKYRINGEEKEISILYGRSAIFCYSGLIDEAGLCPMSRYQIEFQAGMFSGRLERGGKLEIPTTETPAFSIFEVN